MKAILGGYFETALVHYCDAVIRPDRNATTHPYYVCLNRKTPKAYFDRAATFLAVADEVIVPSIDWALAIDSNDPPELTAQSLNVEINGKANPGGGEWDRDAIAFADILLDNGALSTESWIHVSRLELGALEPEARRAIEERRDELQRQVGHHYLCRLLLHVRAAADTGAFLVLSEPDCRVLQEIGEFLTRTGLASPHPMPDLTGKVLAGDDFAAGLLNFSPPDALAMAAVKRDPQIRRYARQVSEVIGEAATEASQRALLHAMQEAHERAEAGRKAEKVFEVASWCVKPLHYVPGVGEVITVAEDVKDLVNKWVDRKTVGKEWYLLAAKMADVAISDYLSRKGNLL
ncbi:hypothetical protein [Phenylobacterium sp.]|uniref:hypothetical protein n=1 Tax=Phenylobacterium sp. TaxID=1871053 RepID=UPI0035ADFE9C